MALYGFFHFFQPDVALSSGAPTTQQYLNPTTIQTQFISISTPFQFRALQPHYVLIHHLEWLFSNYILLSFYSANVTNQTRRKATHYIILIIIDIPALIIPSSSTAILLMTITTSPGALLPGQRVNGPSTTSVIHSTPTSFDKGGLTIPSMYASRFETPAENGNNKKRKGGKPTVRYQSPSPRARSTRTNEFGLETKG